MSTQLWMPPPVATTCFLLPLPPPLPLHHHRRREGRWLRHDMTIPHDKDDPTYLRPFLSRKVDSQVHQTVLMSPLYTHDGLSRSLISDPFDHLLAPLLVEEDGQAGAADRVDAEHDVRQARCARSALQPRGTRVSPVHSCGCVQRTLSPLSSGRSRRSSESQAVCPWLACMRLGERPLTHLLIVPLVVGRSDRGGRADRRRRADRGRRTWVALSTQQGTGRRRGGQGQAGGPTWSNG